MRRLILALQFLTRLPLPNVRADAADFAATIRWFPLVGLIVGFIVAGATWAGAWIDPWTGALTGMAAWVAVTGALHLDGLADLADGLGAAHGAKDNRRSRLLTVMADPHVGSFGVVAIGVQLLAKTILLHGLIATGPIWPLILFPFAARIGPLAWTRWLPPIHAGLGATFAGMVRGVDIGVWILLLCVSAWAWPVMLAAPLLIAVYGLWLKRTIGGVSGDCHGAGIEIVETGLLFASVIACRL